MTADGGLKRSETAKTAGRPRDDGIDDAVIAAVGDLLVDVGYARVTVAMVAAAAGTTKTAIYRRWRGKSELVHAATFGRFAQRSAPIGTGDGTLADEIDVMIEQAREVFDNPVTRAALPGLIADMAADPELHRQVLAGFGEVFGAVADRMARAVAAGEVRPDIDPVTFIEVLGGAAILRTLMNPDAVLDDTWAHNIRPFLYAAIVPG